MTIRERSKRFLYLVKNDASSYIHYSRNSSKRNYGSKNSLACLIKEINTTPNLPKSPNILLYSDDVSLQNTTLLYGLISNSNIYIVPKNESSSTLLSIIYANDINLIITNFQITKITTLPILNPYSNLEKSSININDFRIDSSKEGSIFVLSPGTTDWQKLYAISYDTIIKTAENFYHEMFISSIPTNELIIIGNWEQMFMFYTLIPLLHKGETVKLGRIITYSGDNLERVQNIISNHSNSYKQLIISATMMRKVWDHTILELNNNKFVFNLNKYKFFKSILMFFHALKLERFFGKKIKDIHIVNNDLGKDAIKVFINSNINFTSSYGTLEIANFIAYKDTFLFKNLPFCYLNGGRFPTKHKLNYELDKENEDSIGELIFIDDNDIKHKSDDMCSLISLEDNLFLNYVNKKQTLFINNDKIIYPEEIAFHFKDSLLIRDFVLYQKEEKIYLLIEPRSDVIDMHFISFNSFNKFILEFLKDFQKEFNIIIHHHAILSFKTFRNYSGKIILHLL